MNLKTKIYQLGELQVEYLLDQDTRQVAVILLPEGRTSNFQERREWLEIPEMVMLGMDKRAWEVGSLCHLSFCKYPQGKGAGETLKHGPATKNMLYKEQYTEQTEMQTTITTVLESDSNCKVHHILAYDKRDSGITVQTKFINESEEAVRLDFLTSVSLDNLSPFAKEDIHNRLVLHRFYGGWSLEGKHREDFLEELNLERSWMCAFPESEKFGSVGSYPVHRYFPMACVEDRKEKIFWGIQLEAASSWQMELSRDGDCCSFSAGIADKEWGSWSKLIEPGISFETTRAYVAVGETLDQVCSRILEMHQKIVDCQPLCEQTLPIIFNDWCATYGEPSHEKVLRYAKMLEGTSVEYIVIDAGWTESPAKSFGQGGNGDWNYSKKKFPNGLKAVSREIQKKGFKLGIWFEFEVTTSGAVVFEKPYDAMHLTRDGHLINTGGDRTFWDFRLPETQEYLVHKVIDFLIANEISYLKIDYNSSIGIGCDGAESLGEGLREQMEAVQSFLKKIRIEIPEIVIENCASGGHRLEASFMDLTAMSSFSDAHECRELPFIAANLQRLVLARQNQIWVVINEYLTEKEVYYRLASGFLGRFCLSGNIEGLSVEKWNLVKRAMEFYKDITEIIKYGTVRVQRTENSNMQHLEGIQIVERMYKKRNLIVIHSFSQVDVYSQSIEISGGYILSKQGSQHISAEIEKNILTVKNMKAGEGLVLLAEERG